MIAERKKCLVHRLYFSIEPVAADTAQNVSMSRLGNIDSQPADI